MAVERPEPYVVTMDGLDPGELLFNAGRGVQTLVADLGGRIVAAVIPVEAWYPGATVPAHFPIRQSGRWIEEAIDARAAQGPEGPMFALGDVRDSGDAAPSARESGADG